MQPPQSTSHPSRPAQRIARSQEHSVESEPLTELSSATRQYLKRRTPGRRPPRRLSIVSTVLAAATLGAVLFFAEPLRYESVAIIEPGRASAETPAIRTELLTYCWSHLSARADSVEWDCAQLDDGRLRLAIRHVDRNAGRGLLETVTSGFVREHDQRLRTRRRTPTDSERLLAQQVARVRALQLGAEENVQRAIEERPEADPRTLQDSLRAKWEVMRDEFAQRKQNLLQATQQYEELTAASPTSEASVRDADRQAAREADEALMQDLDQLSVRLGELRANMIHVERDAVAALDDAMAHATALSSVAVVETEDSDAGPLGAIREESGSYLALLTAFRESWDREFHLLRELEPSPYDSEILATYERVRSLQADFLFRASRHLTDMREALQTLAEGEGNDAAVHVANAAAARSVHALDRAHRRAAFAIGDIDASTNFKIDAPRRSARGLHRRTADRIREIDQRLQAEAAEHAREEHAQAVTDAQQQLQAARTQMDLSIDEIVNLQAQLNIQSELTEDFLYTVMEAELAAMRSTVLAKELALHEGALESLEKQREAIPHDALTVVSSQSNDRPVNLLSRLRTAGLGALLTFILVGFAQWWITRPE